MEEVPAKSITVGITVRNNSSNILYLLRSLLKQKGNLFSIDEIIVVNDGSIDNTVEKVSQYSQKYPIVRFLNDGMNRGRISRIKEIFALAQSTYVLIFDADALLLKNDVVDKMVRALNSTDVGLVSVNCQPVPGKGLRYSIIKSWYHITQLIWNDVNDGNTIFNANESAFGLPSDFARDFVIPKEVTSLSRYLYILMKSQDKQFKYVEETTVLVHIPKSFEEYREQLERDSFEKKKLIVIFDKEAVSAYHIPLLFKMRKSLFILIKKPYYIFNFILLSITRVLPRKTDPQYTNSIWSIAPASKRKVHSY